MNVFTRGELEETVMDGVAVLVVRDDTGEILLSTAMLEQMFGYVVRGELVGRCVDVLVPADRRDKHRDVHRPAYSADPTVRPVGVGLILEGERADRSIFPVVVSLRGRVIDGVRCTVVSVIDLTEWRAPGVEADALPTTTLVPETPSPPSVSAGPASTAFLLILAGLAVTMLLILLLCGFVGGNPAMASDDDLMTALTLHRQRDFHEAARRYALAATAGSDPTLALGGQAECLLYLKEYDLALAVCDDLERRVANCARAAYVRGLVLMRQRRPEEAAEHLRLAARRGEPAAVALLRRDR